MPTFILICLAVIICTIASCTSIDARSLEQAQQLCANHGQLRTLEVINTYWGLGGSEMTAKCSDGVSIWKRVGQ